MSDATKAVVLSYASQDAEAARRICEALRAVGVEVWFDQNELVGGDAWDAKIRKQIADCALFVPMVSAATQARHEGYFRLEWKLAAQRTHMMSGVRAFLLPVVIDETHDLDAHVPEEFRAVQWTRLPGGETPPAFCARVKKLLGGETAVANSEVGARLVRAQEDGRGPVAPLRKPSRPWLVPTVGGLAAALLLVFALRPAAKDPAPSAPALAVASQPTPSAAPSAASSAPAFDSKSVAVMAFKNLSSEKDSEYFSDGLSENIRDKLAGNSALRLVGSTSSFFYKGKNVPIAQIARELDVGTLVEGSVQRSGDQLRVVAQIINTTNGAQLWSEKFDRELTTANLFAVQDEIAQKIAARLAPTETPVAPTVAAAPTKNLAAYEAYLHGRSFQTTATAFRDDAIREYQRAVALDPQFALAWAQLAQVVIGNIYSRLSTADLTLANRALDEARRLSGDFFETHLAASRLHRLENRYDLAEADLAQAERLRPRTGDVANLRGLLELQQGRWSEGISLLRQATELDPQNGYFQGALGNNLRIVGRYGEAEQTMNRAFALTGADSQLCGNAVVCFQWKGDAALALKMLDAVPPAIRTDNYWSYRWRISRDAGDYAGALAAVEKIRGEFASGAASGRPKALLIALARESQGDAAGAQRAYAEALPGAEQSYAENPQGYPQGLALAEVYASLGRKDEALAIVRELRAQTHGIPIHVAEISALRAQIEARFGLIDEALQLAKTQIPTGWWKRNDLLLCAEWAELRKDPRFRALAEKAPL